jgi:predicted aconitase
MSILQTTNWAKAAADSGLDLLADLPAPKADPLETVSDAPATSSQELLVFNCDNSTPNSALRHVEDAIEKINTRVEAHHPLSTPCRPSTPWPY